MCSRYSPSLSCVDQRGICRKQTAIAWLGMIYTSTSTCEISARHQATNEYVCKQMVGFVCYTGCPSISQWPCGPQSAIEAGLCKQNSRSWNCMMMSVGTETRACMLQISNDHHVHSPDPTLQNQDWLQVYYDLAAGAFLLVVAANSARFSRCSSLQLAAADSADL